MRVLVCGSRTYEDKFTLGAILSGLQGYYYGNYEFGEDDKGFDIIEGDARGADRLARDWALGSYRHEVFTFPADWKAEPKRAGYLRNVQMLEEGKPNLVVAFVDKLLAESKGTAMMVDLARKAGVKTIVVQVIPGERG